MRRLFQYAGFSAVAAILLDLCPASAFAISSAVNISTRMVVETGDNVLIGGFIVYGSGPDDTGQGRWIPTTSVDEFSATLATWFGVSTSDLPTVLPNIGRFANPNLGIFG
jgi:hypothetical protein